MSTSTKQIIEAIFSTLCASVQGINTDGITFFHVAMSDPFLLQRKWTKEEAEVFFRLLITKCYDGDIENCIRGFVAYCENADDFRSNEGYDVRWQMHEWFWDLAFNTLQNRRQLPTIESACLIWLRHKDENKQGQIMSLVRKVIRDKKADRPAINDYAAKLLGEKTLKQQLCETMFGSFAEADKDWFTLSEAFLGKFKSLKHWLHAIEIAAQLRCIELEPRKHTDTELVFRNQLQEELYDCFNKPTTIEMFEWYRKPILDKIPQ